MNETIELTKDDYVVNVTNRAKEQILKSISSRGKGLGIRVGVKSTGCNGYAYIMEFVDELSETDILFTDGQLSVISDPKSMLFITNITLDFIKDGLKKGFDFINPNAKGECGCGESFNV